MYYMSRTDGESHVSRFTLKTAYEMTACVWLKVWLNWNSTGALCSSAEVQRQRLRDRSGLDTITAQQRIAAEMPLVEKCRLATVVIDNMGSRVQLQQNVHSIHSWLRARKAQWKFRVIVLLFPLIAGFFLWAVYHYYYHDRMPHIPLLQKPHWLYSRLPATASASALNVMLNLSSLVFHRLLHGTVLAMSCVYLCVIAETQKLSRWHGGQDRDGEGRSREGREYWRVEERKK